MIEILDQAREDLIEGFHFYEEQQAGLGSYFLSNLYADIESLLLYSGSTKKYTQITFDCCPVDFHSPFTTLWRQE